MNYPTAIVRVGRVDCRRPAHEPRTSQPASARYAIAGDGAAGAWVLDVARHAVGLQTRRKHVVCTQGPHGQTVVSLGSVAKNRLGGR